MLDLVTQGRYNLPSVALQLLSAEMQNPALRLLHLNCFAAFALYVKGTSQLPRRYRSSALAAVFVQHSVEHFSRRVSLNVAYARTSGRTYIMQLTVTADDDRLISVDVRTHPRAFAREDSNTCDA